MNTAAHLLDEEDKLRADMLGIDPTEQAAFVDPKAAPPAPAAEPSAHPEGQRAPLPAVLTQAPPVPVPTKIATTPGLDALAPLKAPEGPTPMDRASAALYYGLSRQKMPDWVLQPEDAINKKGSQDPYAAFKAELMARKFGLDQEKAGFDQTLKTQKDAESQKQLAVINGLKEKGLINQETAQALKEKLGMAGLDMQGQKLDFQKGEQEQRNGRFGDTALNNYEKQIKDDLPVVNTLQQIENQAPGLTHGALPSDTFKDGKVPEIGFIDKVLAKLPMGFGTQFTSEDKNRLNATIRMLYQQFAHPQVGSNYTEGEAKRMAEILQSGVGATPQAQAAMIDMVRQITASKLKTVEAAFRPAIDRDPQAWNYYTSNGGVHSGMPLFAAPSVDLGKGGPIAGADTAAKIHQVADDAGDAIQKAPDVAKQVADDAQTILEEHEVTLKNGQKGVLKVLQDGTKQLFDKAGNLLQEKK